MKHAAIVRLITSRFPDATIEYHPKFGNITNVDAPKGKKWEANGCHALCTGGNYDYVLTKKVITPWAETDNDDLAERLSYGLMDCDEGEECEVCNEG